MPAADSLPAVEACLDLYFAVDDAFGTDPFDPDSLDRTAFRMRRTDADWWEGEERRLLLDFLVAYGLLERVGDGAYRIRCAPDEDVTEWESKAAARARELRRRTHRRREQAAGRPDLDESIERAPTLTRAGDEFRSVFVDDDTDFDSVVASLAAGPDAASECPGVVFRSPGEAADRAQRLADRLCDGEATADGRMERRFEKVRTDLVGEEKDALEFRLFLRAVR